MREDNNKAGADATVTGHGPSPACSTIQQIVYPLQGNSTILKCSVMPVTMRGAGENWIFICI